MRIICLLLGCACLLRVGIEGAALQVVSGPNSSGKVYLPVVIDGKPVRAFLDSGSAATIVANAPPFASYRKVDELRFHGAAGIEQSVDKIQLQSIQLDDLVIRNPTIGRAGFRGAETSLGIDVLNRQAFSVSVKRKVLNLAPSRPATAAASLEVSRHGLLSIPISTGAEKLYALWDTGAGITTVDNAFIEANPGDFKATKKFMRGTDGAGKPLLIQLFRARRITVGDETFENPYVAAVDLGVLRKGLGENVHAVIGFNLIAKADWYFEAKTRLWHCERK